jgi:glycosyltransferase involved in cell wall biosynthesis
MAERKHISLIYQYDDNWIGGTYYILNVVRSLSTLNEGAKPFLTIFYNLGSALNDLKSIEYPYIEYIEFSTKINNLKKAFNQISLMIFDKELFLKRLPVKKVVNFYFKTYKIDPRNIEKYFFWIADLQDLCLPHFFKQNELESRLKNYKRMVREKQPIVFSSNAAVSDFNRFFPENKNIKKILPFASISSSDYAGLSIDNLKNKFEITKKYFIVCNQFWAHKNHKIVLKAFAIFIETNPDFQLLFTGKEYDHRDPKYTDELKLYVKNNNLTDGVKFLGFINRDEQLKLMSESVAVIQPSLFEGWSTVVEDSKFLNKTIICSDIAVHREQLQESDLFFKPDNEYELVEKMEIVAADGFIAKSNYNYNAEVMKFAEKFIELFN